MGRRKPADREIDPPPMDRRAAETNLAMTNANYVFAGAEFSWAKSASFSDAVGRNLAVGAVIRVAFADRVFHGRLARRLCLWGDEEYLECPYPRDFLKLVGGRYRRAVDVALNAAGQLVLTYTPSGTLVHSRERATDGLARAKDVRMTDRVETADRAYLDALAACRHAATQEHRPDPAHAFLERTFVVCADCQVVRAKSGSCARDACDCSRHAEDYIRVGVCRDW